MKFTRFYLYIAGAATGAIGLTAILSPKIFDVLLFGSTGPTSVFFLQMLGSTLMGYTALNIWAAYTNTYSAMRLAVMANMITLTIAVIVILINLETIEQNKWVLVSEHILFTLGFWVAWLKLEGRNLLKHQRNNS